MSFTTIDWPTQHTRTALHFLSHVNKIIYFSIQRRRFYNCFKFSLFVVVLSFQNDYFCVLITSWLPSFRRARYIAFLFIVWLYVTLNLNREFLNCADDTSYILIANTELLYEITKDTFGVRVEGITLLFVIIIKDEMRDAE